MGSQFLDVCRFVPTAGGLTDWTFSFAVQGYQSPLAANAVNGALYSYRAEVADLSLWEVGYGTYSTGTGVLTRTNVLASSSGLGKVNFTSVPQVALVALTQDLVAAPNYRGFLAGLTLSTAGASATFSVAAGAANNSTNLDSMVLAAALSKTTAAWVVGNAVGGLDTGAIAINTWYHAHLIKRPDTGVVDVLFSLSPTAPSMPANYTLFRRIGSMKTDGSSHWLAFTQLGDEFLWKTAINDTTGASSNATVVVTLTVPLGVQVWARLVHTLGYVSGPGVVSLVSPIDIGTQVAGVPTGFFTASASSPLLQAQMDMTVRINTLSQLNLSMTGTGVNYFITTYGWIDHRGKDA